MNARRAVLVSGGALLALVTGCNSIGIGVNLPIGRGGSIGVGGSVPLPRPSSPPASAPQPTTAASASR